LLQKDYKHDGISQDGLLVSSRDKLCSVDATFFLMAFQNQITINTLLWLNENQALEEISQFTPASWF